MTEGFHKPPRLDVSDKNGGLLVYVRSYLLSSLQSTNFEIPSDIEAIPFEVNADIRAIAFEVNIMKEKWFFLCIYKHRSMNSQIPSKEKYFWKLIYFNQFLRIISIISKIIPVSKDLCHALSS